MPPKKRLLKEVGQSSLMAWAKARRWQETTDSQSENVEPVPSTSSAKNKSAQDEVILVPNVN